MKRFTSFPSTDEDTVNSEQPEANDEPESIKVTRRKVQKPVYLKNLVKKFFEVENDGRMVEY